MKRTSSLQDFVQLGLIQQLRVLSLDGLLYMQQTFSIERCTCTQPFFVSYQFNTDFLPGMYVQACKSNASLS